MTPRVVGVGLATVDYLCVMERIPRPDEKGVVRRMEIQGGGPAATALVTLQRFGAPTALYSTVGGDGLGRFILDALRREGVDVAGVRVDPQGETPFAFIAIEESTGRRSVASHSAGLARLEAADVDEQRVRDAEALLIDGHHPEAQLHAAGIARTAGVPVVYDAGSPREGAAELVNVSDYLVTSESFPARFTGKRGLDGAMAKLLSYGPKVVVTTLGARGCRFLSRHERGAVRAWPVDRVVDTTGAGDVFHGAFLYGLLMRWDVRRICDFANIAAGLKCRGLGGPGAIPALSDVERIVLHRGPV